ncbi:dTMP kinase [Campylobacter blaseri]|uniref:Thymidylate kinase n=1 Tax=Campylobacter blaseri TaxID=2042961 RepID=A0A2P8QYV8_9BACT|nr:dTMP kinase [Campylobacter blaseri]PSM51419.1 dTMP kinase [Campylobacter blaseri]PSM52868.1 dTMP kinase [Campylobacter blaseri]QKF86173.1 dTMP kinase [Campylobacter blaseri]
MLITFEGIDGAGKSTQLDLLKDEYKDAIFTKEPGGTNLGEKLREILLNDKISRVAEMYLFLADRAHHYETLIKTNKNRLIFNDRGFVSGISYALANKIDLSLESLLNLNKIAMQNNLGDKFVFFKIDRNSLKNRLSLRSENDIIEQRGLNYLMEVQKYMEQIFKENNFNVLTINATEKKEKIHKQIKEFIG